MAADRGDTKKLVPMFNQYVADRDALAAILQQGNNVDAVTLHPNAADRYREKVAKVHEALKTGDAAGREAISLIRELIEPIAVSPAGPGEPNKRELSGNLTALLLKQNKSSGLVTMVAGGVQPA